MHDAWLIGAEGTDAGEVRMHLAVPGDGGMVETEWVCGRARYFDEFSNRDMPLVVGIEYYADRIINVRSRENR